MRYLPHLAATLLFVAGCTVTDDGDPLLKSDVVFLDEALTAAEIDAVKPGDRAYAMVEREEGMRFVPITIGIRYTSGAEDFLTFKDDEAKFGFGDSGSPILTAEGKTIGALSGSFGGDSVLITPIAAMLTSVSRGAPAMTGGLAASSRPAGVLENRLAWFSKGIGAEGRAKLRRAGIPLTDFDAAPALAAYGKAAAVTKDAPIASIEAGRSMAVLVFDGPIVSLFAVGTATHKIGDAEMIAFGHPMNWDGSPKFNLPVTPARMVQFVTDPIYGSFKLAVPAGEIMGGIVEDRATGILLSKNSTTEHITLQVKAGGRTTTHVVYRADDPEFLSFMIEIGLGGIVQGQLDIGTPGELYTSVTIAYTDNQVITEDMGPVDWTYDGAWVISDFLNGDFSTVESIEITLTAAP